MAPRPAPPTRQLKALFAQSRILHSTRASGSPSQQQVQTSQTPSPAHANQSANRRSMSPTARGGQIIDTSKGFPHAMVTPPGDNRETQISDSMVPRLKPCTATAQSPGEVPSPHQLGLVRPSSRRTSSPKDSHPGLKQPPEVDLRASPGLKSSDEKARSRSRRRSTSPVAQPRRSPSPTARRRAVSPEGRSRGGKYTDFLPAVGYMDAIHTLESVEQKMEEEEEDGHHHPLIMLTKTHTGAIVQLHTVGGR